STVALPDLTEPRLDGGFWKGPPVGTWAGVLSAVLPSVAAGLFSMSTLLLRLPERTPLNGIGVGVGTGPPGDGIMITCVSMATILSPCFAAGLPMASRVSPLLSTRTSAGGRADRSQRVHRGDRGPREPAGAVDVVQEPLPDRCRGRDDPGAKY